MSWGAVCTALLLVACGQGTLKSHTEVPSINPGRELHRVELDFVGRHAIDFGEAIAELLPEHGLTVPGHTVLDAYVLHRTFETLPEPRMTLALQIELETA